MLGRLGTVAGHSPRHEWSHPPREGAACGEDRPDPVVRRGQRRYLGRTSREEATFSKGRPDAMHGRVRHLLRASVKPLRSGSLLTRGGDSYEFLGVDPTAWAEVTGEGLVVGIVGLSWAASRIVGLS